jgi:hypothetical protein
VRRSGRADYGVDRLLVEGLLQFLTVGSAPSRLLTRTFHSV